MVIANYHGVDELALQTYTPQVNEHYIWHSLSGPAKLIVLHVWEHYLRFEVITHKRTPGLRHEAEFSKERWAHYRQTGVAEPWEVTTPDLPAIAPEGPDEARMDRYLRRILDPHLREFVAETHGYEPCTQCLPELDQPGTPPGAVCSECTGLRFRPKPPTP